MPNNINLQADEYNELTVNLKNVHEQITTDIESFLSNIEALLVEGEGFTDNMLKPKIEEMITTIRSDLLNNMKGAYKESEDSVSTFLNYVDYEDTVGYN